MHGTQTFMGELGHRHGMIVSWVWQSANGNVAIADDFYLEYLALLADEIEFMINRLQQGKDLTWFSGRTPCREPNNRK